VIARAYGPERSAASRRFVVVINPAHDDQGTGEPVLFIVGRGGAGRTWHLYQVPAFLKAGYRVFTVDNSGVGATRGCREFHDGEHGRALNSLRDRNPKGC
jgi:pimeloyl-ACP methyl ester carboxylesterase